MLCSINEDYGTHINLSETLCFKRREVQWGA